MSRACCHGLHVQRHRRQRIFEQCVQVREQRLARLLVLFARVGTRDVGADPLLDEIAIERALSAEDQIDLERLIEEIQLVQVRLHQPFEPRQQPWQQQVVQRPAIPVVRGGREFAPLIEPEGEIERRLLLALLVAAGHVAQRAQRRQQRHEVGILRPALGQRRILLAIAYPGGMDRGDHAAVADIACGPCADQRQQHDCRRAVRGDLRQPLPPFHLRVAAHQPGLAEQHLTHQAGEKIATAGAAEGA